MYYFQREKDKAELNKAMDITWEEALNDVQPADCEKMNAKLRLYSVHIRNDWFA